VKLDVDRLLTVPADPPAAGPDRALDPPAAPRPGPGRPGVAEGDVAVADVDEAQPAESPINAHIGAATTINPLLLFDGNRRPFGRRACLAMVTKLDLSDENAGGRAGAAPAAPEIPATGGPDGALMMSLQENMETTPTVRRECTEPRESR
jgi:hypothetical protein